MEDWALIRRLSADGLPKAQIAARLGLSRNTVAKAVAAAAPPKYERAPVSTAFTSFEDLVRALLGEYPQLPATVIAERVGWAGSITWFRDNVRRLRVDYLPGIRLTGWSMWPGTRRSAICGSHRPGCRWARRRRHPRRCW